MSYKSTGGPIHPVNNNDDNFSDGITRRDWLAGLAMQGLLANSLTVCDNETLSKNSYEVADDMIARGKVA